MGLPKLNNKGINTPTDRMTVREFKRVAEISDLERIYDLQTGRVLGDAEVIDTRDAEYGSTTDWERGSSVRSPGHDSR
jgi:hypothetical protein